MSPSGLHFNKPLVVTIVGVILTLGVIYKYSDTLGLTHSKTMKQEGDDMPSETGRAVPVSQFSIPEDLLTKAKTVKVVESTVEVPFKDKKIKIFLRKPDTVVGSKLSVLLLHGQSFTSNNWNEIGTIQLLGVSGYNVIAVDLPGFGKSDTNMIAGENKGEFLGELIKTLKLESPVIVSPSMSGSYALPYLFNGDASSVSSRASAYVAIAPVDTGKYKDKYPSSQIKTLIIRGSRDENLGTTSEENLKALPSNGIYIIPNAGHACYMNDPVYFHKILYSFLKPLSH